VLTSQSPLKVPELAVITKKPSSPQELPDGANNAAPPNIITANPNASNLLVKALPS
jgi:hypothetical protein